MQPRSANGLLSDPDEGRIGFALGREMKIGPYEGSFVRHHIDVRGAQDETRLRKTMPIGRFELVETGSRNVKVTKLVPPFLGT
jgi:hypothetical protein